MATSRVTANKKSAGGRASRTEVTRWRIGVSSRRPTDFTKDLSGPCRIPMAVFVSIAKRLLDSSPWSGSVPRWKSKARFPRMRNMVTWFSGSIKAATRTRRAPYCCPPAGLRILPVHCWSSSDRLQMRLRPMAGHWKTAGQGYVDQSHEYKPDFQRHNCPAEGELAYPGRDGGRAATGRVTLPQRYHRKGPARRWNHLRGRYDSAPGKAVWFLLRRRTRDRFGVRRA